MLLVGTERTHVAWGVVHQAMSHHFILTLEAFPTHTPRTAIYRTEMRPVLRVDIGMGAEEMNC